MIYQIKHTRQFSNQESRLLLRSHTFAIIVILDPIPVKVICANLPKDHNVQAHENTLLTISLKL